MGSPAILGAHPTVEGVLSWIASALTDERTTPVPATVAALAHIAEDAGDDPAGQLAALGERVGRQMQVVAPQLGHRPGYEDLRPDLVLARLAGDELVVAASIVAIAQRADIDAMVVTGERRALVAHRDLELPFVLSPRHESRIIDARDLRQDLHWAEPVDVALHLLDRIDERAALLGDLPMRIRAHEHQLALPLDREERSRRGVALARAKAGLN